ncbi:MAG TPA: MFS transporter [Jatrophihabitans sp.]|jgi:MFS family permease|uniref:MFS transporter n=1 Tax=Jatrophihabitans sp. TaxID=1932789 RepID=UPI002DFB41BF|nr:MFS transporter [Jatrophihabitans sp.]
MSFTSGRRDLRLVIGAKAVSFLGDEVAALALVLRLQSHGAGFVAAVLIANLAPIMLLSGVVGRLVDRRDNRALLITSSLVQAALCGVLAFTTAPVAVLTLVGLLGIGQAVNGATWQALIPSLVGPAELARAIGRSQAATTVAGIAAPALGGLLVARFGAGLPLLIDTATFLAVTGAALLVRARREPAPANPGEKPAGGVAIVRREPLLRATLTLLGLFVLLGSMVNVVEVFLVRRVMHASAAWYGISAAAFAVGLLVGSLLAGRLTSDHARARGLVAGAALLGVGLVGMGVSPGVQVLTVVATATGVCNGVLSVCTSALLMGSVQPGERGRVGALVGGVVSGTQLIAYAAGGALAAVLSPRTIFVLGGVLGALVPLLVGRAVTRAARVVALPVRGDAELAAAA